MLLGNARGCDEMGMMGEMGIMGFPGAYYLKARAQFWTAEMAAAEERSLFSAQLRCQPRAEPGEKAFGYAEAQLQKNFCLIMNFAF